MSSQLIDAVPGLLKIGDDAEWGDVRGEAITAYGANAAWGRPANTDLGFACPTMPCCSAAKLIKEFCCLAAKFEGMTNKLCDGTC